MEDRLIENADKILDLAERKKYSELRLLMSDMNPYDIAEILESMSEKQLPLIFRLLPKELAADAFVAMDPDAQENLIVSFSDNEIRDMFAELYLDDAADIIDEMPANVVARIMRNTDEQTRKFINEICNYPDDSAGSIMTPEYVDLRKSFTVGEALERIRLVGTDKETVYTCYVTENRKLIGVISAKTLLISPRDTVIGDIMHENIISVNTHDDQEYVATCFKKYGYLAIPVVDKEMRLVGIVTIDDALGVLTEEATEDIEKMAAITPSDKPYRKTGVFSIWLKRIPWLMLLMISATFTGKIITSFESALSSVIILTAYIPMLMDTAGNAGSQASVTIIRGLSLGEISPKDILAVLFKEVRVAFLCGLSLGVANFGKMLLIDRASIEASGQSAIMISFIVCLSIIITIIFAKTVGCTLPIIAKRIGLDPAVMASPFITTIVDMLSLLVYFNLATHMLHLTT